MSWPTWSAAGTPIPTPMAAPVQSTLLPAALNSAPAVIAPVSYSQEQWAQAQQQNWQQWAQWQQQYQQWHQQYGAEYQKSISAMQGTVPAVATVQPPLPAAMAASVAPPLPIENKPPLPPEEPPLSHASVYQTGYTTAPLMAQQLTTPQVNLATYGQPPQNWPNTAQKRPHNQESDYDSAKKSMLDKGGNQWNQQKQAQSQWQNNSQNYSQPPPQVAPPSTKPNVNVEELSEAEKKFDKEFAAWEAQFNKWKDQNANHPDKTQYKEYEKKWESWRNSLLERREQMRRKRLSLAGQPVTPPVKSVNNSPSNPTVLQSLPATKPSLLGQYSGTSLTVPPTIDLFKKPPPTQNNEPLIFKSQTYSQEKDEEISGEEFLKSSSSSGIPGLDLVKEDSPDENLPDRSDVVEIDKEDEIHLDEKSQTMNKGPDFEAISKGINSILGDQKLMSMLSMVSQNPPNTPIVTNTTSTVPSHFAQNFSVPPPNLQQHPPGNFNSAGRDFGNNESRESHSNQEEYYQASERSNNFNNQENIYNESIPDNNFDNDGPRNMQDKFNNRSFDERENFSRGSGNFNQSADNFKRNDRFNSKFDNDFEPNINDTFHNDDRDNYNTTIGNIDANNFNKQSSFHRENLGSHDRHSGNFNRENDYDDYDNYNDEDDYEKYNEMFTEDDDKYQDKSYQGQRNEFPQQPPHKLPGLMDQIAPAPPHIHPQSNDEPLFEPTTVIDYEHKSRRDPDDQEVTVEPVNMFDYRHKPLNRIPLPQRPKWLAEAVKFIREFDPMAARYERPPAAIPVERYPVSRDDEQFTHFEGRDRPFMDYDRGNKNEKPFERNDFYYGERKHNTRERSRYNDRDGYVDDNFDREERFKQKNTESRYKKSDSFTSRKERGNFKDDFEDFSDSDMDFEHSEQVRHKQDIEIRRSKSKSPELSNPPNPSSNQLDVTMIDDIINAPGRYNRPPRIVIILRGPPGSGKTFLAKQIKDKEVENGGSAPRILSLDDYFMVEQETKVLEDGKMQIVKKMVYEYEADMEESYRSSFMKSFKKTVTDGYFPFIIVDNVNDKVKHFGEMWSFAKQNGFQVYICQMDLDPVQCAKRNIHNRSETEIEDIISGWEPTPAHHPTIDASGLLQMCAIADVEMELEDQKQDPPDTQPDPEDQVRSKWDNFDCSNNNLAKLDGVSKPIRKSRTMEEYLQLENQWEPPKSRTSGKKRVRWADLEEQRELEKMRAIGFVVGHTDWERMMDPTGGSRALTQTKYIENISRYKHI